ncbi:hypothetical protein TNCT_450291 [Trichonephila clavata]|uniref:Uncharacterized protein n=1 Tax=Trichonephila clavata TaxID=2740835 RepID=A0A8X6KNW8_TRICU|nr:hypothetical protein TNCT_450291 [Trichonephila clavata]
MESSEDMSNAQHAVLENPVTTASSESGSLTSLKREDEIQMPVSDENLVAEENPFVDLDENLHEASESGPLDPVAANIENPDEDLIPEILDDLEDEESEDDIPMFLMNRNALLQENEYDANMPMIGEVNELIELLEVQGNEVLIQNAVGVELPVQHGVMNGPPVVEEPIPNNPPVEPIPNNPPVEPVDESVVPSQPVDESVVPSQPVSNQSVEDEILSRVKLEKEQIRTRAVRRRFVLDDDDEDDGRRNIPAIVYLFIMIVLALMFRSHRKAR